MKLCSSYYLHFFTYVSQWCFYVDRASLGIPAPDVVQPGHSTVGYSPLVSQTCPYSGLMQVRLYT